jgi:tetratricopeptide (TPR) repeat protein
MVLSALIFLSASQLPAPVQTGPTTIVKARSSALAKPKDRIAPAKLSAISGHDDFDRDAAADQRRDEAIAEGQKILATMDDGPQKTDLLYHIAELYWEKSRYAYFSEYKGYDEQVEKWAAAGSKKGAEPKLASSKSDGLKKKALTIYDEILSKYPDYERNDEVLFNKASSLYEAGQQKEAIELYFALIKRFPKSEFVADTYLAMGEHYFNNNDLQRAITAYQKAVQTQKPKVYAYALYKLAWCDYNAQDYTAGIEKFKKVVDYSEQQAALAGKKKKKRDRIQLRSEALKDMLLSYSQIDAIDEAKDYYSHKVEHAELGEYLGKLGLLYEDQGKFDLEVKTLKMVNEEWPESAKAPSYQAAVISAYSHMGKREKVKEEVRKLIALYKPGSKWADANRSDKDALSEGFELTERSLRELTTEYHAEAQKTKDDKTYAVALDLYKEYLDAFPTSPAAYKMRFNYAEILFREKQFEKAAEQYDLVAAADGKGQFLKLSAFASVQAWEQIVEGGDANASPDKDKNGKPKLHDLGKIEKLEKGKAYAQEPIPDNEQKLAQACERFVKVLPKDEDVVKVKFKEARIYFVHNHFDEAATRFAEIIQRWPNDKLGRLAATLVLESFNVRGDWAQLNKYARQFKKNDVLMKDATFAKETQDFVEGSAFKMVQGVEAKGDLAAAGQGYRSFVEEFPKSPFAPVALYDAMIISDKSGQLDIAIPSAEHLLREYPEAKTHETTMFLVASLYERIGEFEKAEKGYEAYLVKYPKGTKAQDALWNAALFADVLGNTKVALADYDKYMKEYPASHDSLAAYDRQGKIFERLGDIKKVAEHYAAFAKKFPAAPVGRVFEAHQKTARAYKTLKKDREAFAEWKYLNERFAKLTPDDKKSDKVIYAAAQARYELYEPTYQSYMAVKLQLPSKKMTENLVRKAKMLGEVEKEYTQILAIGNGEYGIAALTRIGVAYNDFSKALMDAPVPNGLTDEQREIYQSELQNRAFPIEEKAIEAYEKALGKSRELHLYTPSALLAQDRLAQFKPADFPELHKYPVVTDDPYAPPAVAKTGAEFPKASEPSARR